MTETLEGFSAEGRPIRVRFSPAGIEEIGEIDHAPDLLLVPGLIDIQLNGYGGVDVNATDGDRELPDLLPLLWAHGVTTFYPTVVSAAADRTAELVARIAHARATDEDFAGAVPGIHLEGPYLSGLDGYRGAHDPAILRDPDTVEFDRWQRAAGGLIRIVTLAPERAGAADFTRHLTAHGVTAAIGHSAAGAADVAAFRRAGGRFSTHLGNGIPASLDRHDNVLWPQLAEPGLAATLIADGHHLPLPVFTALLRAKGLERAVLVSDAVTVAGCPPGDYRTPVGGDVTVELGGRVSLRGTAYLAGSGASLAECVRWACATAGLPAADAFAMATRHPADLLGLTDRGRLAVGARADLVRFERDAAGRPGAVRTTVAGGVVRFDADADPVRA
ncbi:N-acetylglucosamine-6-phosphate deacetylase [Actinacidiphila alni]|uniref:N-acetylglucosamine-6-phosphate deacetylase n=1 Tax=Actinacidiphila alni TaxID=380248 RepID=UPI003456B662